MAFTDTLLHAFTNEKIAKYVSEYVGTALLILIIKLSIVNFPAPWPAISVGACVASLIYNYGYISSALFNPSLTLAFIIRNQQEWPRSDICQIVMYFITQYTGAITGGLISWFLRPDSAFIFPSTFRSMEPETDLMFRFSRAFVGEVVFTFFLTTVLLHEGTDKRQSGNQHYGMAVGMCVTVSIMCIGDISGCCLNSAVWLGTVFPALLATWINADTRHHGVGKDMALDLSDAWIYWIAPFMGAAIASFLYNVVYGVRSRKRTLEQSVARHMTMDEANEVVGVVCSPEMDEPSQTITVSAYQCRE